MKQENKKKAKQKKSKNSQILENKENKLNWQQFNFLENLLIFCALPERSVPQESGVNFRITLDAELQAKRMCILFEIDRKNDPLIRGENIKRPDYMSFYIDKDYCICTIIEMKSKNHSCLKTGIEQIRTLKENLQKEISDSFFTKLKVKFQGILLTPHNSQPPFKLIEKEEKNGLIILPLQHNEKAELYDYVSKLNKLTERYEHRDKISEAKPLLIEEILTTKALPKRINGQKEAKEGININYLSPNDNDIITLVSTRNEIQVTLLENEDKKTENEDKETNKETIEKELKSLNLNYVKISVRTNVL